MAARTGPPGRRVAGFGDCDRLGLAGAQRFESLSRVAAPQFAIGVDGSEHCLAFLVAVLEGPLASSQCLAARSKDRVAAPGGGSGFSASAGRGEPGVLTGQPRLAELAGGPPGRPRRFRLAGVPQRRTWRISPHTTRSARTTATPRSPSPSGTLFAPSYVIEIHRRHANISPAKWYSLDTAGAVGGGFLISARKICNEP